MSKQNEEASQGFPEMLLAAFQPNNQTNRAHQAKYISYVLVQMLQTIKTPGGKPPGSIFLYT